jgi:hypothetical protein
MVIPSAEAKQTLKKDEQLFDLAAKAINLLGSK